jgi:DNA-binding response OmpR family regulator
MHERILIVDDERFIAQALALRLQTAGYQTHCAHDGGSAVAAAAALKPDLVLLDIRMPDMDGFEAYEHMKACPGFGATPVVFLSANVQESARQAALASGASEFLIKPYEAKDILSAVKAVLDRRAETADVAIKESSAWTPTQLS